MQKYRFSGATRTRDLIVTKWRPPWPELSSLATRVRRQGLHQHSYDLDEHEWSILFHCTTASEVHFLNRWMLTLTEAVAPREEKVAMLPLASIPPTPNTSIWSAGLFRVPYSGPSLPIADTRRMPFADSSLTWNQKNRKGGEVNNCSTQDASSFTHGVFFELSRVTTLSITCQLITELIVLQLICWCQSWKAKKRLIRMLTRLEEEKAKEFTAGRRRLSKHSTRAHTMTTWRKMWQARLWWQSAHTQQTSCYHCMKPLCIPFGYNSGTSD